MSAAELLEPELVECDLECRCRERCTMALPGDEPVRATLAALVCPSCGRTGTLTLAPAISFPPTRDPDDNEEVRR
jgi:hypothetical protein